MPSMFNIALRRFSARPGLSITGHHASSVKFPHSNRQNLESTIADKTAYVARPLQS